MSCGKTAAVLPKSAPSNAILKQVPDPGRKPGSSHFPKNVHPQPNPACPHPCHPAHPRGTGLDGHGNHRHHHGRTHGQPRPRHLRRRPRPGPLQHHRLRHRRRPPRPRHLPRPIPRRRTIRRGQPLAPSRPHPRRRTSFHPHPHRRLCAVLDAPPTHRPRRHHRLHLLPLRPQLRNTSALPLLHPPPLFAGLQPRPPHRLGAHHRQPDQHRRRLAPHLRPLLGSDPYPSPRSRRSRPCHLLLPLLSRALHDHRPLADRTPPPLRSPQHGPPLRTHPHPPSRSPRSPRRRPDLRRDRHLRLGHLSHRHHGPPPASRTRDHPQLRQLHLHGPLRHLRSRSSPRRPGHRPQIPTRSRLRRMGSHSPRSRGHGLFLRYPPRYALRHRARLHPRPRRHRRHHPASLRRRHLPVLRRPANHRHRSPPRSRQHPRRSLRPDHRLLDHRPPHRLLLRLPPPSRSRRPLAGPMRRPHRSRRHPGHRLAPHHQKTNQYPPNSHHLIPDTRYLIPKTNNQNQE